MTAKEDEPNIDIGTHCNEPYPCDAKNYCWSHIPNYSIFDISRLKSQKKFELYQNGILYPAGRMDADYDDSDIYTLGYTIRDLGAVKRSAKLGS